MPGCREAARLGFGYKWLMQSGKADLAYRLVAAGLQAWIWGGEVLDVRLLPREGPSSLETTSDRSARSP
jgi:hypothetical protein